MAHQQPRRAGARSLRRTCRRRPGVCASGMDGGARRQAEMCQFQSNAVAMRVRARAARRLVRFSRLPFASVFFVNSGAEANEERAQSRAAHDGPAARRGHRRRFSRPHRCGGRGDLGGAGEMVRVPRRAPFDVSFIPRGDPAAIAAEVTRHTAAVIRRARAGARRGGGISGAIPRRAARAL